ncbi:MAG: FkbM family methyltransferase [Parvibaculaceae bacterium]|nr:FkbM family methyltransferase [Parvibaculaceae bacterium]
MKLTFRQRATWLAHLFKAVAYQYHRDLGRRLAALLPEDGVAIDVGAHAGQHAKLFAKAMPRGTVYAFEPGSYALSILRKTLFLHRLANVVVVPCGLSNEPAVMTLSIPVKKRGSLGFGLSHLGAERPDREAVHEEVRLVMLDGFVAERGIGRIDFIKADIEGWEPHFLRGALASIDRFRPSIMLEVNEQALPGRPDGKEIFRILEPFGYAIFKTFERDAYRMVRVDRYDGPADYVFVPEAKAHLIGQ